MTLTPEQEATTIKRLGKPSGLIQGFCNIGGDPIILDPWQAFMCDTNRRFTIWNKGRQGGASFAAAGRAWARSYLSAPGTYLAILTSYNLEDAKEKIRYVKMLDRCLPGEARLGGQARAPVWAKTELEFSNHNRIVTMFRPRGKGPADVMIDEMAHMQEARSIYRAALPVISRGGSILIFSTPLARHGMFSDIWGNTGGRFSKYKRVEVPWWVSSALCVDVPAAAAAAPGMATEERVAAFGVEALQDILGGMFLEDFQTEYECAWSDESRAAIPWDLIELCSPTGEHAVELAAPPVRGYHMALAAIGELRRFHSDLYAGMDFGRIIDATEVKVGEQIAKGGRIEERLSITLKNCPFQQQWAVLERICSLPQMRKVVLDHNGLGMPLSEQAKTQWSHRVISQVLSRTTKPEIFNHARAMMEKGFFAFYPDRDTRQQFHSIKKVVTAHGNVTYDVDRNEKHHADKFWAAALMLWGAADSISMRAPSMFILDGPSRDVAESEIVLPAGITVDPRK